MSWRDLRGVGATFSRVHFLLLFPGFFFYQAAVGYHWFPPLLGGYFGLLAMAGFPALLLAYWLCSERYLEEYTLSDLVFGLLIVLTVVVSVAGYAVGKSGSYELLVWSLSGLLFNVTCYILAETLDMSARRFRSSIYASLGLMVAIVVAGASYGSFDLTRDAGDSAGVATYQALARSLVVVSLVAFAMSGHSMVKAAVVAGTVVALFLNGARSEFAIYVLAVALYISAVSAAEGRRAVAWAFALLATVLTITTVLNQVIASFPETRMDSLFDVWSSSSGMERQYFSELAMSQIAASPIWGEYGGYLSHGGVGAYAHNLLSAWVNLGILGFSLYVIALMSINYGAVSHVLKSRQPTPEWQLAFLFSLFVTFALMASKDYSYMLFGMAIGFYSRAAKSARAERELPVAALPRSCVGSSERG